MFTYFAEVVSGQKTIDQMGSKSLIHFRCMYGTHTVLHSVLSQIIYLFSFFLGGES